MACRSCTNDVDHCHGLLIVHADGSVECCEPDGCPGLDPVLHDVRLACDGCDGCLVVSAEAERWLLAG
ncbi:MAG: hypothetical protein QOG64_2911 [Acidimicrobiaceae bacterium]|jgi:hypothetical protein|nr:hypothetical protein [Acidimicrobiaceae bacterium]